MTLRFVEKTHAYYLDGRRITGVTTLLGRGIPKPALTYWSARCVAEWVADNPDQVEQLRGMGRGPMIAALKGVPWEKRDTAAIRGTDIHSLAERIIHGETADVPEHLAGYVDGYTRWLDDFDIQPILTEQPVASRKWQYGGKFDAIVTIGRGKWAGRTAMLDWKTSAGVYGETALQVAAYASAEFYASDPETETPLPPVDCTGVVHITEGGATLHPLAHTPDDIVAHFKLFSHAAYVAKNTDYIKGLVGPAMTTETETE